MIALDFTFFWSRKVKQTQGKVIIFLKNFLQLLLKKSFMRAYAIFMKMVPKKMIKLKIGRVNLKVDLCQKPEIGK